MRYTSEQTASLHEHTFSYITVAEEAHLLTITLSRARKKNAMTPTMVREIVYALSYGHHNRDIWAIVIAAAGDVFSAGMDLKAFRGEEEASDSTVPEFPGELVLGDVMTKVHKPVISRVQGNVYAGGFLIVAASTYVIAAEDVIFSLPEVKRGIWPMQVSALLLNIMPRRQVLDLCIRAKTLTAAQALEVGLITHRVAFTKLDDAVSHLCEEIFTHSPSAIRLGLAALDEMRALPLDEHQSYLKKMLDQNLRTEDANEGIQAFFDKRKPQWTGN